MPWSRITTTGNSTRDSGDMISLRQPTGDLSSMAAPLIPSYSAWGRHPCRFMRSNSDIARQLYIRHKAGDSGEQLELNSVPVAVSKRLHPFNIAFNDLPGLVQRAVLWDTGFAISPGNDAVQIRTMKNYSMADIAIPKSDVASVDCSLLNCSQPNDVEAYYTKYCTGYQILNASRCVVDLFEDSGAGSFLGMMWSVGGDPDMTPELRLRDHTWTQDIEEFGGNVTFSVYAVHTVSSENDPAWDVCPSGYASLTVPCHRRDQFSDEYMAANTTVPTGSAWVTTWLEEEFAQSSGFDDILMIPILLSVVIVVGFGWFCWKCIAKRKKEERSTSATAEYDFNSTSHYWGGGTPDMVLRPMMVTSQLSSQLSNLSMQYESAGSNTTLQILLGKHGGMPKPFYVLQDVMAGRLRPSFSQDCPLLIKRIGLASLALDPHVRYLCCKKLGRNMPAMTSVKMWNGFGFFPSAVKTSCACLPGSQAQSSTECQPQQSLSTPVGPDLHRSR
ncbi:hypothetical protein PC128_g5320 [Phytophthora cactorum]|nr:hypothetical protein PC128_g5320 [Phytophthora cactorum]